MGISLFRLLSKKYTYLQRHKSILFLTLIIAAIITIVNPLVLADTISGCTNITVAGRYTLTQAITNWGGGVCINISVSNVEIDCVDWNNWIDGKDTGSTYGIKAEGTASAKLTNVSIKNCNLTNWFNGAYYEYVENSTLSNVISSSNTGYGIYVYSSSNTMFKDITLSNNNLQGIAFYGQNRNNTIMNMTSIDNAQYDLNLTDTDFKLTNPDLKSYCFKNVTLAVENTSYARISLLNVTENGTNFTEDFIVRHNYIFVNSSKTGLNKSADLSFYGLAFSNPRILRDGAVCPSSICTLIAYNSSNGTLIFNVTGFSAYSTEETPTTSTPSSVSGGGGGGSAATTYSVGELKEAQEVNKELGKGDKIIFNLTGEEHKLEIKKITSDNAIIELNSTAFNFSLAINESKKFNLTSSEFYDFFVRLNDIKFLKANLTLIAIHEAITLPKIEKEKPAENVTKEKEGEVVHCFN